MAESTLSPLQSALYTKLTGNVPFMAAVTGLFDWVPEGTAYPYVTFGEAMATPRNAQDRFGRRTVETLHVWSKQQGMLQVANIMSLITQALDHQTLTVTGHDAVMVHHEFEQTLNDPDPEIRHGVIRFAITTEET